MMFQRFLMLLLFVVVLMPKFGRAQISQGGEPMKTGLLKSSQRRVIEMPPIKNFLSIEDELNSGSADDLLKPFQFAYPFEVDLTPSNSGEWLKGENGFYIWKLNIRSVGAKSLNLIFDDFKIPENARLFVYSETENHILGAFTSINNKPSGKFAISPVLGDEITVQYEIPEEFLQSKPFRIVNVNHDYVGILKSGDRRPLGKTSGACNIDVNCDEWEHWSEVKNSVCRLIINGKEFCSGTLVNNTAENQKPYILSAAHCYGKWNYPETTVYAFNYESPFCAPLDGDPSNSISGATMKAQFDSLDFALVELTVVPPPNYRPYFAGWDRSNNLPNSSASIHHPQADIKKISIDNDSPVISSYPYKGYTKNGYLWIKKWDGGVTESGSSGGALFSYDKHIIGTLLGGEADCKNPINDYYTRFSLVWDYKTDTTKQLKHWLDPLNSDVQILDGKQFNEGENLCDAFTNLTDNDSYNVVPIVNSNIFEGYWGGTNNIGITEIMERFSIKGNEILSGVSLGVGKFNNKKTSSASEITIKVYNGNKEPESLIYSKIVKTANLAPDAMNFIGFNETVSPEENFFVGFELSNIQALDSFVVYQSLRSTNDTNFFYYKQNNKWFNFKDFNSSGSGMSNIFELVACNIDDFSTDTPLVESPLDIVIFPNPSNTTFILEAGQDILDNQISVFNLLGQKINVKLSKINQRKVDIDLRGNVPGVYFIRFDNGENVISSKVSFVPW